MPKNTTTTRSRRLLGTAAAVLMAGGLTAVQAPAASAAAGGTTTDAVNIRAEATTGSAVLGTIPGGVNVTVECQTEGQQVEGTYSTHHWGKVTYNGQTGYVSRAYVTIPDATGLGACDTSDDPAPDPGADRQQVLDRANHWVSQGLPYSMEGYAPGPDADGYKFRTDCSGMVAMAYNLRDQSYSTVNLPEKFSPIAKEDLQPGDIIGNLGPGSAGAAGHVVIFNGWVDDAKTQFRTLEQNGGHGAVALTHTWGNAFWSQQAYRYNGF